MKSIGIYYVESPFQLLCAIEASHSFRLKNNFLYIRLNGNVLNEQQLKKIARSCKGFTVKYLNIRNDVTYLNIIKLYHKIIVNINSCYLFVGDIRSKLLGSVKYFIDYSCIFILDDGIASLSSSKKYPLFNYFTFLDLKNVKTVRNDFTYIKNNLIKEKIYVNKVFFLGSPLVERGIISEAFFLKKIKEVIAFFFERNIDFYYILHRNEEVNKLSFLKQENIIRFDLPIELFLLEMENCPRYIASFYSAGLLTVTKMIPEIKGYSFYITNTEIKEEFKNQIQNCYNYYEKIFGLVY